MEDAIEAQILLRATKEASKRVLVRVADSAPESAPTRLGRPPRSAIPGHTARRASDCTGSSSSDMFRANVIALPGAWAMGDGLVLETDLPPPMAGGRRRRAASVASYTSSGESLGESLYRMAGSFTASMNEYIQDLANWANEYPGPEGEHEEEVTVSGGSFFDGGQLLFPRADSCRRNSSGSGSKQGAGVGAASKKID